MKDAMDGKAQPIVQWVFNQGLHASQWMSVRLGGDPDESTSSRTGRAVRSGVPFHVHYFGPFINWIFRDPSHNDVSLELDETREKEIWDWNEPGLDLGNVLLLTMFMFELSYKVLAHYLVIITIWGWLC